MNINADDRKTVVLSVYALILCSMALYPATASVSVEQAAESLADMARPLRDTRDLSPIIDRAAGHAFVLLGEASHGTAEFYTWRAEISRRLVEERNFSFIAVEGDWDACWRVNEYVKLLPGAGDSAEAVLRSFDRWPLWMWANREVETLIEWLRAYNSERPLEQRVGFYGIDVYGLEGSMRETLAYFEKIGDEEALATARAAYACLESQLPPQRYAQAAMTGAANCETPIAEVTNYLREQEPTLRARDEKAWFNAKQHALVVQSAERHYRAMVLPGGESWNFRVAHFKHTVERLIALYGNDARGIVWAHNTHIGDARATPMAQAGRANIGQLLREKHGEDAVFAVGFGTHRGAVLAGSAWEAPMERMTIPPAMPDSFEDLLHRIGRNRLLLIFEEKDRTGPLALELGHRAIGVVYNPARERFGNYVPTIVPHRYDAFIFISETTALNPLH